jgi:hypothetical protein
VFSINILIRWIHYCTILGVYTEIHFVFLWEKERLSMMECCIARGAERRKYGRLNAPQATFRSPAVMKIRSFRTVASRTEKTAI